MARRFDLILKGGNVVLPTTESEINIGVINGKISALDVNNSDTATKILDVKNLTVLPGIIDSQVHFREPGLEHKENIESGTKGALLGGVTAVFEMPNTNPATTTPELLADKVARAKGRSYCNIGFFIGGSAENISNLAEWESLPGCVGIKIFMGSSTGSLLLDKPEDLRRLLKTGTRRVTVHAEDNVRLTERKLKIPKGVTAQYHPIWRDEETAILATQRLVNFANEAKRRVHVLHISTAEELEILAKAKSIATVETLPQFLTFEVPECYERLGTLAQMNPPIRGGRHREALWKAVQNGVVDVIGSDHAPHTLEEKARPYPESPSGMTGVQTILPLMLTHMNDGRLTLRRLVQLLAEAPARTFGAHSKGKIEIGADADFSIVDLNRSEIISNKWIASRCGWTPYDGMTAKGWPVGVVLGGQVALWDCQIQGPAIGKTVEFSG